MADRIIIKRVGSHDYEATLKLKHPAQIGIKIENISVEELFRNVGILRCGFYFACPCIYPAFCAHVVMLRLCMQIHHFVLHEQ